MACQSLTLKAVEAYARDVGRVVVRMDYESMKVVGVSTGDIVEITGKGRIVAKCLPLYPSDEGKRMVRVDGVGRHNLGGSVGDELTVRKTEAVAAEKVAVAPLEYRSPWMGDTWPTPWRASR